MSVAKLGTGVVMRSDVFSKGMRERGEGCDERGVFCQV